MSRCGRCKGKGWHQPIRGVGQVDCPSCKGTGVKVQKSSQRAGHPKKCPTCGTEFYRPPSFKQIYCSNACVPHDVRFPPGAHRKAPPSFCVQCGAEFYARPSRLAKGSKFCSRKCFFASGVSHSEEARQRRRVANKGREGKNNPNFKHGKRAGDQIRGFTLALKGEDRCRNCGASGVLHLHHAIPRSLSQFARDKLLNGVPLCPKCHHGWHRRCLTIYRDIFTEEEWAFLSSVELTGQRIEAWLDDHYPERANERLAA